MKTIEHYQALRERMVSERVTELMKDKHKVRVSDDYSISRAVNISEYMREISDENIERLHGILSNPQVFNTKSEFMETIGRDFYCGLLEYWEVLATKRAERDIPSVTDLMDNDQADAEQDSDNRQEDARIGL